MAISKVIDNYQIYVSSYPQFNEWQANILLRKGGKVLVDVRFAADPSNWVKYASVSPDGVSCIYVDIERYPWFVDILRNEKPLTVLLYPADETVPARMLLQTGAEPVGETEPAVAAHASP